MPETVPGFDEVFAMYQPKILHYLSNLQGEHDAEDLTQIVFLKVHDGLKDFRGDAKLSTWIYRIATNVVADRARNASSKETPHPEEELLTAAEAKEATAWAAERAPDVDQALVRQEMNSCIRAIVDQLPEKSREVIVLSEFEGIKNAEIAEILGITLESVKIRLFRGRAKLKQEMENQCNFYRDERNELACDKKGCSC